MLLTRAILAKVDHVVLALFGISVSPEIMNRARDSSEEGVEFSFATLEASQEEQCGRARVDLGNCGAVLAVTQMTFPKADPAIVPVEDRQYRPARRVW